MKNNIRNKVNTIARSKFFFAFLVLALIALSVYIIWGKVFVKGETRGAYHTVVWIDAAKLNLTSTSEDMDTVLAENNITVYPEDKISTDLILDPVVDEGAGQRIVIKRAPVYYLTADGATKEVRTWDSTVSAIIAKAALPIGPKDQLSSDLNSWVTPGATIVVTRINEADVDVFEEIPFETVNKGDASVAFGQEKVVQAGVAGRLKKTYRILYKNGVEVSRRLIAKETVTAKKDKIIASGIIVGRANFGYYSGMVTSFYKGMTGKYLLVTNLANGKSVRVKIIGSGPFNGPILDMGTEPFQAIGGRISDGYIPKVSVQLVD